jgi:transcription initiation factor TFIID subunit 1
MQETDDTWYSIFPVENEELVYGTWEDEVIWDSESMNTIPKPKILTLDPNDENIVLGIPEDVDPSKIPDRMAAPVKVCLIKITCLLSAILEKNVA